MAQFAHDALRGLTDSPRWLPCRYLYDERGSELFEQICDQPEYYQTRTEALILERHAARIRSVTGPVTLIELGSGTSAKTDYLLAAYTEAGEALNYVPVDVSEAALLQGAERIAKYHPNVQVVGIVGTYESAFPLFKDHSPAMVVFLGSTIGNMNITESAQFFAQVSDSLQPGDFFLLGVDLVKDGAMIEAAYNDAAGITAQFTTNIFARMNRELASNVDLGLLRHVATYNPDWQRMEIFVEFLADQDIRIEPLDKSVSVAAGERVMIEISRKFVIEDLKEHVEHFGFTVQQSYFDPAGWFGLLLMQRSGD